MTDRSRTRRFELVDGPLPAREPDEAGGATGDPTVGRARRSLTLRLLTAGAALAVALFLLLPRPERTPTPPPVPTTSAPATSRSVTECDLSDPACRVVQTRRWRDRTAAILRQRLDPKDSYFTGYSYAPSAAYETGRRLEALGLEVYRLEGGGTEVFVQVARTSRYAVRCGELTRHRCVTQRFMDGNTFAITPTTEVADGIEVQYCPAGSYVITLAARNTTAGRPLALGIEDLMEVAQDPRLGPPPG